MVDIAKPTIAFKNGSRMDLQKVYGRDFEPLPYDENALRQIVQDETSKLIDDLGPLVEKAQREFSALLQREPGHEKVIYPDLAPAGFATVGSVIKEAARGELYTRIDLQERENGQSGFKPGALATLGFTEENILPLENATLFHVQANRCLKAIGDRYEQYRNAISAASKEDGNTRSKPVTQTVIDCNCTYDPHFIPSKALYLNNMGRYYNNVIDQEKIKRSAKSGSPRPGVDLIPAVCSVKDFLDEEIQYKRLFIDELSRMLAEKGYDVSAEQLFRNSPEGFGSQSLLFLRDYGVAPQRSELPLGENETTTSLKFDFTFKYVGEHAAPCFAVDVIVPERLKAKGIPDADIENWFKGFLKMAAMAEHDYIHQIISTNPVNPGALKAWFASADEAEAAFLRPPYSGDLHLEDHSLSLHAQIVTRLLEKNPIRKEAVLRWAAESYAQLSDMQKTASAHCADDKARHDVNEAITYLAEIYSHRLFRVISPDNPALHTVVETRAGAMSVADAMDSLTLLTPAHLLVPERGPVPTNGLERLTRHCEDWLGETYKRIFTMTDIPAQVHAGRNRKGAQLFDLKYVPMLEIVDSANAYFAHQQPKPSEIAEGAKPRNAQAYLTEAKLRANTMREAAELRAQGKERDARTTESRLRLKKLTKPDGEHTGKDPSSNPVSRG